MTGVQTCALPISIDGGRLLMGFAQGTALEVRELQVEGKKRMTAHDFINGYRPRSDEVLGTALRFPQ